MRKIQISTQISPLFFRVQGQKCMATPRTSIRGECLWVKMPLHAFLCSFVYTQPPEKDKHGNISSTRYVVMYEVYIKKKVPRPWPIRMHHSRRLPRVSLPLASVHFWCARHLSPHFSYEEAQSCVHSRVAVLRI